MRVHPFSRTATGGGHSIADLLVLFGFTLCYSNFVFGCIVDCVIVESVIYMLAWVCIFQLFSSVSFVFSQYWLLSGTLYLNSVN